MPTEARRPKHRRLCTTALVIACFAISSSCARPVQNTAEPRPVAQDYVAPPESSSAIVPIDAIAAEVQRARVMSELERLDPKHPWAGVYDTFHVDAGTRIAIAPEAGFALTNFNQGGMRLIACGRVLEREGCLSLDPEYWTSRDWSSSHLVVPTRWGERRYLLLDDKVVSFCNSVNSGREARSPGRGYWARCYDEPVAGFPELPSPYDKWIFETPIAAPIVEVVDERGASVNGALRNVRRAVFGVGGNHGVFEGMKLFSSNTSNGLVLTVKKVGDSTCEAECTSEDRFYLMAVGQVFSTRSPNY